MQESISIACNLACNLLIQVFKGAGLQSHISATVDVGEGEEKERYYLRFERIDIV